MNNHLTLPAADDYEDTLLLWRGAALPIPAAFHWITAVLTVPSKCTLQMKFRAATDFYLHVLVKFACKIKYCLQILPPDSFFSIFAPVWKRKSRFVTPLEEVAGPYLTLTVPSSSSSYKHFMFNTTHTQIYY